MSSRSRPAWATELPVADDLRVIAQRLGMELDQVGHEVLETEWLEPDRVKRLVVKAPWVARRAKAGQFVRVLSPPSVPGNTGEPWAGTIADADPELGTISLVVLGEGASSKRLMQLEKGDFIPAISGPCGTPTHIENKGTVVLVLGGVGAAVGLSMAREFRAVGNRVVTIIGGRDRDKVILRRELGVLSHEVICTVEQGSLEFEDGGDAIRGRATVALEQLLNEGQVDMIMVIGRPEMMEAVDELAAPHGIEVWASVCPPMRCTRGMCGACAVEHDGETKFGCWEGPDFMVRQRGYTGPSRFNFQALKARLATYRDEEVCSVERVRAYDERTGT